MLGDDQQYVGRRTLEFLILIRQHTLQERGVMLGSGRCRRVFEPAVFSDFARTQCLAHGGRGFERWRQVGQSQQCGESYLWVLVAQHSALHDRQDDLFVTRQHEQCVAPDSRRRMSQCADDRLQRIAVLSVECPASVQCPQRVHDVGGETDLVHRLLFHHLDQRLHDIRLTPLQHQPLRVTTPEKVGVVQRGQQLFRAGLRQIERLARHHLAVFGRLRVEG